MPPPQFLGPAAHPTGPYRLPAKMPFPSGRSMCMVRARRARMQRREFLRKSGQAVGAAWLSSAVSAHAANPLPPWIDADPLPHKFKAQDEVVLGHTGIRTSRLAMGTGTIGGHGGSNQTRLGMDAFVSILLNGYHENGFRFFDPAGSSRRPPFLSRGA